MAIESADLALVNDDPLYVVKALVLAKKTYGKMIQNLFWATGYNVIASPLAACMLSAWGYCAVSCGGRTADESFHGDCGD